VTILPTSLPPSVFLPDPTKADQQIKGLVDYLSSLNVSIEDMYRLVGSAIKGMIQSGLASGRPAATGSSYFYYELDNDRLYYDSGIWELIAGSATGITNLDGGCPSSIYGPTDPVDGGEA
jgi:hypothetical protein